MEHMRNTVIKNVLLIVLVVYSGYMTGQHIYKLGANDGAQRGYQEGLRQGFEKGKQQACMIKPI
jgi:hypothetical protein